MPWVYFTRDFDWRPPETGNRVTIAYKAGMRLLVRRKCAEDALAAGAAQVSIRKGKTNGTEQR